MELQAVRSKGGEQASLIAMLDGDSQGVAGRRSSLATSCIESGINPPSDADHVLVCIPTWNIETWLAYLGGETVDEGSADYPRLARPRDCTPMFAVLVEVCRGRTVRDPFPPSLEDTCTRYHRLFG